MAGPQSEYDLVVRNARIVDGSGGAGYVGDVAVKGDRIASVGAAPGKGAVEIEADGKVLAPGFIDIHTHYDPQICWDRMATPSPEHGVTSLIMGNCSISLAPVKQHDRQKVIRLFGAVEDMEGRLLEATVPFRWETVPQYLAYLREELGPNIGVMIGHSVLRLYVMGEDSAKRAATADEIAQMSAVLAEALEAGAFGLSFSYSHYDDQGAQLPCYYADRAELKALLQTVANARRGVVEVSPSPLGGGSVFDQIDLFGSLAIETGASCSLSPLLQLPQQPDMWPKLVERFESWRAKGAPIFAQTQTRPLDMTTQLSKGATVLVKASAWRRILELPMDERRAAFADPAERDALYYDARTLWPTVEHLVVRESTAAANQPLIGRSIGDIAAETGRRCTDVVIDIALADDLDTVFSLENFIHADTGIVAQLLDHPAIHIGSGDAGAHITSFAGAGDTSYLFERFVRELEAMTLERAVQRLTSDIARDWKIHDRGEIATGKFADLVLFDPDRIARGEEQWVEDVPGGNGRYVRRPEGIDSVIVNGQVLVDHGKYTGQAPGRIL